MPQPVGVTVFYGIISGIALMAIPLITCIFCLLILRRVDTIGSALVEVSKAVDGKLEMLMSARETVARAEGKANERETTLHTIASQSKQ
jgi:hypothetical protein